MEVVTTHINADFDAMASMIAAKKLYPEAVLVFPGSQERTLREFFINSTMYIYDFKRLRDIDLSRIHRLRSYNMSQYWTIAYIGNYTLLLIWCLYPTDSLLPEQCCIFWQIRKRGESW